MKTLNKYLYNIQFIKIIKCSYKHQYHNCNNQEFNLNKRNNTLVKKYKNKKS